MAARYDASCASSGSARKGSAKGVGRATAMGVCHSWSDDGRCVSLLKLLFSNSCAYDCAYCINRRSADTPRATFTPEEVADLTIQFYLRNYIEGLFLSSAVIKNPDYTMELLIRTLTLIRKKHRFNGYIHLKAIPGANASLLRQAGFLADRISANIELPTEKSLSLLAPEKKKVDIFDTMKNLKGSILEHAPTQNALYKPKQNNSFIPAGQSTQLIVGATPENDNTILTLSEALYSSMKLRRVYYSAYIPTVTTDKRLPVVAPPLMREHRLYQADWLLRFYGFRAHELLSEKHPNFDPNLDPKCFWAVTHFDQFPVEINTAPLEILLRVPGIGIQSAEKIVALRRVQKVTFDDCKKMRIVMKRARFFITCNGKHLESKDYTIETLKMRMTHPLLNSSRSKAGKEFYEGQSFMFMDHNAQLTTSAHTYH